MKKHLKFLALSTFLFCSVPTYAEFYAGLGIGSSLNSGNASRKEIKSEFKNSPIYSLSGGYTLPLPLLDIRGEAEYLRIRPEVKDGRTKQMDGLFLNAYGVIPFVPLIDPYVGFGLGRVRFDHANSYATQWMMGIEYEVPFWPITLAGEYRYLKINEITGKTNAHSKFHTNILMLKARYLF